MPSPSAPPVLSRAQRMLTGMVLLLGVDVIWVASSEFTEYIFHDLRYDKPFFSTYLKTSLFMTYLAGFALYRPWREEASAAWGHGGGEERRRLRQRYQRVNESEEDAEEEEVAQEAREDNEDAEVR